jgi:hypothetical protein
VPGSLYNDAVATTLEKIRDRHFVPRPLPEPVRTWHVSAIGQPPTDELGRLLEQWLNELRGGYTIAGD